MTASPQAFQHLPLTSIANHPHNPRRELRDIPDLAASIRTEGILEPLLVAPLTHGKSRGRCSECEKKVPIDAQGVVLEHPEPGGEGVCAGGLQPATDLWVLIAGHRRRAAAELAGLDVVPCVIRWQCKTEVQQLTAMLHENGHRDDLTPIEEATGYTQLELRGLSHQQIATQVGRPKRRVEQRLALMDLPEETREKVHGRQISLADAEALLEFSDHPKTLKRLEEALGTPQWRWELQKARDAAATADEAKKKVAAARKAGVPVVEWAADESMTRLLWMSPAMRDGHEGMPCHAVAAAPGNAFEVCTDPASHRPEAERDGDVATLPTGPHTPAGAPAREVDTTRAAERLQREEDLRTAAGLRREFVLSLTDSGRKLTGPERDGMVRVLLRAEVLEAMTAPEPSIWFPWFGVDAPDSDGWETDQQLALAEVERRDPVKLALALAAACHEQDSRFTGSYMTTWHGRADMVAWLDALVDLGYELTDLERQLLAPPVPAEQTAQEASA